MNERELLARIDERTEMILKKLDVHCHQLNDHEKRISKLEQWRAYILGAAAVVAFIISVLLKF